MRAQIKTVEHVRNTVNGNSVWRIEFADGGKRLTKPDSSVGCTLGHSWEGRTVDFTLTSAGRIDSIERVE